MQPIRYCAAFLHHVIWLVVFSRGVSRMAGFESMGSAGTPDQAPVPLPSWALANAGRLLGKDLRQHRWLLPLVLAFEVISLEILRAQTGPRAVPILLQL